MSKCITVYTAKRKFLALNAHTIKEQRTQINKLSLHFKGKKKKPRKLKSREEK